MPLTDKDLKKKRLVAEHNWFCRPPDSAINASGLPPPLSDLAAEDDRTQHEARAGRCRLGKCRGWEGCIVGERFFLVCTMAVLEPFPAAALGVPERLKQGRLTQRQGRCVATVAPRVPR
jgi:hypothetical protein